MLNFIFSNTLPQRIQLPFHKINFGLLPGINILKEQVAIGVCVVHNAIIIYKMQRNIVIAMVILAIGVWVGYELGSDKNFSLGRGMHMMPDGSLMGSSIDQHFIVQMIPHHEGAIAMARVALERSKHQE